MTIAAAVLAVPVVRDSAVQRVVEEIIADVLALDAGQLVLSVVTEEGHNAVDDV